jgi:hypothetical protein
VNELVNEAVELAYHTHSHFTNSFYELTSEMSSIITEAGKLMRNMGCSLAQLGLPAEIPDSDLPSEVTSYIKFAARRTSD